MHTKLQFINVRYIDYIMALLAFGSSFLLLNSCKDDEDTVLTPEIASFSPSSGTAGSTVTISGKNFRSEPSENEVSFNGTAAQVQQSSATELQVVVPEGATSGKIKVTVQGKSDTSAEDFTVIVSIKEFIPASGPIGTTVVIRGSNFSEFADGNQVNINGVPVQIQSATHTVLVVTVPENATTGKWQITANGQTAVSDADFVLETSMVVSTYAGSDKGANNGPGAQAKFLQTYGLAFDGQGNLYATEPATHRIRKITPQNIVSTYAGTVAGYADGELGVAMFRKPSGVAVDAQGNMYVADYGNHRIRKISPGNQVSTVAGTGEQGFADGAALEAKFDRPRSVAVDTQGNIYVGEISRIRKITPDGTVTTWIGGNNAGLKDGTGTSAEINGAADLTWDSKGNLFIADYFNNSIRKISPSGEVTTVAGNGQTGMVNGLSTEATFNHPSAVYVNAQDIILVADTDNRSIRKIYPQGVVVTLAGTGTVGIDNGKAYTSTFTEPVDIAVDANNNIFISDNFTIRKISLPY